MTLGQRPQQGILRVDRHTWPLSYARIGLGLGNQDPYCGSKQGSDLVAQPLSLRHPQLL